MFPNDMMVKERMADRMREADANRRSRPLVEARASARRARVRNTVSAALAAVAQPSVARSRVPASGEALESGWKKTLPAVQASSGKLAPWSS